MATSSARLIASVTSSPGTSASFTVRVTSAIHVDNLWQRRHETRTRSSLQISISTRFARCATRGSSTAIAVRTHTVPWWQTKTVRRLHRWSSKFMDLSITVNGMKFPNPFVLGSGPPGTNARVLAKSFDAGWGGAVAKTVSLESAKVVNVVPRYGKLRSRATGEVIGFENIELISDPSS